LEGLSNFLPGLGINHFMTGVKESYYGFSYINNYEDLITLDLSKQKQKEFASAKPDKLTEQELILHNSKLFVYILDYIKLLENNLNEHKEITTLISRLTQTVNVTRNKNKGKNKVNPKNTTKAKRNAILKAKIKKFLRHN